jgi:hypothetical protein
MLSLKKWELINFLIILYQDKSSVEDAIERNLTVLNAVAGIVNNIPYHIIYSYAGEAVNEQ